MPTKQIIEVNVTEQVSNKDGSTLPDGMRQGLIEVANLSGIVSDKWASLAQLAHDGGIYASYITPATADKPNDEFDLPMYSEIGQAVAEGMKLGYLLYNEKGDGLSRDSWKHDALKFGAYPEAQAQWNRCIATLRKHLEKIEAEGTEREARKLDSALALIVKRLDDLRADLLKLPVKRQDIPVADAAEFLKDARENCKALKHGVVQTVKQM